MHGLLPDKAAAAAVPKVSRVGLSWKIALAVFLSLVAVEAAILIPSYFKLERDLLLRLEEVGRATIVSTFRTQSHASTRDLEIFGRLLVRERTIAGGGFYSHDNERIAGFGAEPALRPTPGMTGRENSRSADGKWLDVVWHHQETRLPWTVAVRLDARWVPGELRNYVILNAALVALISIVVCGMTMLVLHIILLRRIGKLHGWLSRMSFESETSIDDFPRSFSCDEFDQMARTLRDQADRAKDNFLEIRRDREQVDLANRRLEAMIEERTKELRAAKAAANLSNHAKTEFLAHMSHELRTPLNAIIGFSRILKDQMFGPVGHRKYAEYADDIARSGENLATIVDDILDVSHLQLVGLSLADGDVDIEKLVEGCINALRIRADLNLISLKMVRGRRLPHLRADERRMKQIFQNLLVNAIKFSPPRSEVIVRTDVADDGAICVTVEDNGIGIPPDDIPRALEPFGKIRKSIDIANEGTGLGLFIARCLVELHEGTFSIGSKAGRGTTVSMRFPASRSLLYT